MASLVVMQRIRMVTVIVQRNVIMKAKVVPEFVYAIAKGRVLPVHMQNAVKNAIMVGGIYVVQGILVLSIRTRIVIPLLECFAEVHKVTLVAPAVVMEVALDMYVAAIQVVYVHVVMVVSVIAGET